jgi:hypothetical protein
MPARKPKGRWILRTLVVVGVVLILVGGWLYQSDFAQREAARISQLPRSDAAGLQKLTPGTEVLLEGTLVAREPAGPRGFIAFHHERFTGLEASGAAKGNEKWIRVDTVRPALAIASGGATAEVASRDYRLDTWRHAERTDPIPRYVSMLESTERFLGFKAGDEVTVEGRVVEGLADQPGVRRVEPAVLFGGGGAAAYVESARAGIMVSKIVGGVFGGLGALMAGVCAWWLRTIRNTVAPRRPEERLRQDRRKVRQGFRDETDE